MTLIKYPKEANKKKETIIPDVIEHKEITNPKLGRYVMIGQIENDNSPW